MKYLKYSFAVIAILVAGLAVRHFVWGPPATLSSEALYAASFPDSNGDVQKLGQWRGKLLVVNFWATWCPPCREEMPELSKFHEHYQKQGIVVVGIATDDVAKMQAFGKELKVSYPLLAGDLDAMNLANALGNNKGILPYTVVLDQQGNVVKTFFGRVNSQLLEEAL
ncbi:MAG TPA: TlpA disulfide reductase family protein, partial [Methylophilaceae bacterium]|nr:TlpA disulfide reductase family protein [Methylophilaceae bacterium]